MIEAFPLYWPVGYPRTKYPQRSKFRSTFGASRDAILHELKLLGAKGVIISTNIPLRGDGLPYATYKVPEDKGVAVYFELYGQKNVFACDKWDRIEDNMKAVMFTVEALRGIDRWGVSEMLKRSFTGHKALPQTAAKRAWYEVLDVPESASDGVIKHAYRELVKKHHPDTGGDANKFHEIQNAYEEAMRSHA